MKKKAILVVTALIEVLTLLLCSCSKVNKFVAGNDGEYIDKKTEVHYIYAPPCYEALGVDDAIYGQSKGVVFHGISGLDPNIWLCEESGTIFYADSVTLPTLEQMNIDYIGLYSEDSVTTLLETVRDSSLVDKIKNDYLNGEHLHYPGYTPAINLRVKFVDSARGICYTVVYLEYASDYIMTDSNGNELNYGRKFFYNRFDGTFCSAGDYFDESYNSLIKQ